MKVVIDTNVLLMSLPKISPYRLIFDELINGKYELLICEGIFQEYKEIIAQKTTKEIAENFGELITQLDNVTNIKIYYNWKLIEKDPDDDKFVDCALSGNAKFIVSNDKHFNVLKDIAFPRIELVKADKFLSELKQNKK